MADKPAEQPEPDPKPQGPSQARKVADQAAEKVSELAAKAAPVVVPAAEQAMVNLRVWVSFLQNPKHRECAVKYRARERREAGTWNIVLPQQCWDCGTTENIKARKIRREVRSFENAIPIMVIGPTLAVVMLLFSTFCLWGTWSMFMFVIGLAMLVALGTVLLLLMKSWREDIRLTVFSCPEHADALKPPDLALDQEQLHMFLYNARLAEAAKEDLKAQRRGDAPGQLMASPGDGPKKKRKPREAEPIQYERPKTPDLPPIGMEDSQPPTGIPVAGDSGTPAVAATVKPKEDLPPIKMDDSPIPMDDGGSSATEFSTESGMLAVYDGDALTHRTTETWWWQSADELLKEINAANVLAVKLGAGSYRATEVAARPTGQTASAVLHVPSGSIVIGSGECLGKLPAGVIGQRTVIAKPAGHYQVTVRRSGNQLDVHFASCPAGQNSLTAPLKLDS